jgi:hypothetical protein
VLFPSRYGASRRLATHSFMPKLDADPERAVALAGMSGVSDPGGAHRVELVEQPPALDQRHGSEILPIEVEQVELK